MVKNGTSTLLAVAGATLVGLYFIGKAGAAQRADGEVRAVTVEGRNYNITKLGAGMYRVERLNEVGQPVTRFDFGQDGPIAQAGDPQHISTLREDIQKLPSDLFS